MIIRITANLGKKVHIVPTQSLPLDPNPFADWSARLFTAERIQYIMLTNTACLYSLVMYGRGITDDAIFLKQTISTLNETLRDDGLGFIFEQFVAPATDHIALAKALNRAVTGSMNDLVFQAKLHLIEGQLSPYDVASHLNTVPMSLLKYDHPREALLKLAQHYPGASSTTRI